MNKKVLKLIGVCIICIAIVFGIVKLVQIF